VITLTVIWKSLERVKYLEIWAGIGFEFEFIFKDLFVLKYTESEFGFLFEPRMSNEFFVVFAEIERAMVQRPMKIFFGDFVPVFFGLTLLDFFQFFDFKIQPFQHD
jgi:hypothetical protein